jgi:hypothetical protein
MGVAFKAEQSGALGAQRHHLGDQGAVVGAAAILAARGPRLEGALA